MKVGQNGLKAIESNALYGTKKPATSQIDSKFNIKDEEIENLVDRIMTVFGFIMETVFITKVIKAFTKKEHIEEMKKKLDEIVRNETFFDAHKKIKELIPKEVGTEEFKILHEKICSERFNGGIVLLSVDVKEGESFDEDSKVELRMSIDKHFKLFDGYEELADELLDCIRKLLSKEIDSRLKKSKMKH